MFFTYDLEHYKDSLRDFYFDMFEEVPGPIVKDTPKLIEEIERLDDGDYESRFGKKYDDFQNKYNEFDKGVASKKVIELIRNRWGLSK